jgi:catechol 2,3-dioxygenase-like lactoylglutathione lyase family enzyme
MINALQHVGQGVRDVDTTYGFYKKHFGFKVKLNDLTIASKEMAAVIGSVETMRMMMAVNAKGGGIIELIEHKSKPIKPFPEEGGYGDYGVLEVGYGVDNIDEVVTDFEANGARFLTRVCDLELENGRRWRYAYLRDPDGLPLQLTEDVSPGNTGAARPAVRGVTHVGIGVSDLARSKEFYGAALGFDHVLYEHDGRMPEMDAVTGEARPMRMAILERSAPACGPLAELLPRGVVKLFEVPGRNGKHLYDGRCWGDIGCMEVCLDVSDLMATVASMQQQGIEIYLPPVKINMGSGSRGLVAYVRDPDGTTIEFVEVQSIAWLPPALFMRTALPLLRLYDRLA